jgi:hypothetical protein
MESAETSSEMAALKANSRATDGTTEVDSEYLEVTATRA